MRTAIAIVVSLAWGAPAHALDVVHFKDGREPMRGVILSETEKEIEFRFVLLGAHGEVEGTAESTILRAEVKRIERMTPAQRREAIARSEALGTRAMRIFEALAKMEARPAHLLGMPALLVDTKHFRIYTTCDELLLKETAFYLEEMYRAYQRFFGLPDAKPTRLNVYLLADKPQFDRFQKRMLGFVVENPGYYDSRNHYIAARNFAPVGEVKKIRANIEEAVRTIRGHQEEIEKKHREITVAVRAKRKKIETEAARARRIVQQRMPGNAAALRKVEELKRQEIRKLKADEKKARAGLEEIEDRANAYIREGRRAIVHNNRLLIQHNEVMFRMLFHEGFHAFANRHLVIEGRLGAVPRWLNEGLACYFEQSIVEAGFLIHGVTNDEFRKRLGTAMSRKELLPLAKIVSGRAEDFVKIVGATGQHSDLYYAQSWALVHYLMGRVTLERLQAYLKLASSGRGGSKAFEAMMGKSIRQIEIEVRQHIRDLDDGSG